MYTALERYFTAAYQPSHYPTLAHQRTVWRESKPLTGLAVIDATPLCRNTAYKYLNLIEAGAELTVARNPIAAQYDAHLAALLRDCGVAVVEVTDALPQYDIIMDCGALLIHNKPRIGYVELTRSRAELYTGVELPAFIADSGQIKQIETFLGTGESYFRAMAQFGYTDWRGRKLVIFGSGKVGSGLIHYAGLMGAEVCVITDIRSLSENVEKKAARVIDFHDSKAVAEVVAQAYAIAMATGVSGVFERMVAPEVLRESKAILANMGATDEFGASVDPARVLNGKQTINFVLDDPTQMRYIDATMSLHNYGAQYLVDHPAVRGIIEPPEDLEERLLECTRAHGVIGTELDSIHLGCNILNKISIFAQSKH